MELIWHFGAETNLLNLQRWSYVSLHASSEYSCLSSNNMASVAGSLVWVPRQEAKARRRNGELSKSLGDWGGIRPNPLDSTLLLSFAGISFKPSASAPKL